MAGDSKTFVGIILAIAAVTIAVYFPIHAAGFFSDDRIYLHDAAWFRAGSDGWKHIFGGIFDSGDFFRPLVMALFAAETILFDAAAGPAHFVSIAVHAANVVCVGLLARQLAGRAATWSDLGLQCIPVLIFALHPLLIEPVAWISGQFDLLCTFFVLLALLLNLSIRSIPLAAILVGIAFFLAACSKEAAVSLVPLLAIMDWMRQPTSAGSGSVRSRIGAMLMRRWPVYFCVLLAGVAYLWARHEALGYLIQPVSEHSQPLWPRLQLASFTYLTYWRVMLWPMSGLGFIHPLPSGAASGTLPDLIRCVAAMSIFALGIRQLVRGRAIGALIVTVTAALLPVLHLLPVEVDDSYYHDRYAVTALALLCSWLPRSALELLRARPRIARTLLLAGAAASVLWLAGAALNIRVTLPLWSDDVLMWKWVLRSNPDSVVAKDNLLDRYLVRGDLRSAAPLVEDLQRNGKSCLTCMLNVANFEIATGDATAAAKALQDTRTATRYQRPSRVQIIGVILATGNLRELQGDLPAAEAAYRDAVAMDAAVPGSRMTLARVLLREGKLEEARTAAREALELYAPDVRTQQAQDFQHMLGSAEAAARDARP